MLSNFYKKLLTVVMLICVSLSAFACGNPPASDNSPETNSTSETTSESISESPADKKVEAVIEDEPDGYVIPKIDHVTKKFTQPTLTDDEMYSVVFEKHSEIAKADSEGNYPTPNHELGEAYFAYTATKEFDTVYKCFGISTDIELSDEFSSYKINTNVILSTASSAAPINNAYWHKYFDVMLKNLEFNATDSNGDDYAVFAYIYEKNDDKENTYMVCSDGYVRTKNTDGIVAVSNKKVDAPEIYMVAELFEKINKTIYRDTFAYLQLPDEKITFHYAGKTATIKKDDASALGYNENQDYTSTKMLINEGFLNFDNYVYVDLGNEKFYVIDENSNLYFVWSNFYTNPIIGGVVSVQHQTVRIFNNVFDYSKIIELFR